jgi:hypothetical protein
MSHEFAFGPDTDWLADHIGWKREALRKLISAAFATRAGRDPEEVVRWPGWSVKVTDYGLIKFGGSESYLETVVITPRDDGLPGIVASRLGLEIHYVQPTWRVSLRVPETVSLLRDLIKAVGPGRPLPDDHELRRSFGLSQGVLNAARTRLQRRGLLVHGPMGWSTAAASKRDERRE